MGDEIKKQLTWGILNKVIDGDGKKNNKEKHSWIFFPEMNLFFSKCFIYLPKLNVFFVNRQRFNARAGQKKKHTHGFFCNVRPKYNARAHLKHRKKT